MSSAFSKLFFFRGSKADMIWKTEFGWKSDVAGWMLHVGEGKRGYGCARTWASSSRPFNQTSSLPHGHGPYYFQFKTCVAVAKGMWWRCCRASGGGGQDGDTSATRLNSTLGPIEGGCPRAQPSVEHRAQPYTASLPISIWAPHLIPPWVFVFLSERSLVIAVDLFP